MVTRPGRAVPTSRREKKPYRQLVFIAAWWVCWLAPLADANMAAAAERPNVILVMVDDLGFSDLGYHGSEIETPNLDALARGGVRFSHFRNTGRCCPTRATLMTGLHPHQTGIGHMTNPPGRDLHDRGVDGYRGFLNDHCVTVAEVLRDAGYATLMSGKWHLGYDQRECWPLQRGFDKYYGCLSGATRFFHPEQPRGMTLGNEQLETPESTTDEAFYTTDAFTDYGLRFIEDHRQGDAADQPFFLYLAYTAPHWPLQAFEDDVAKYRGRYRAGWDELRKQRYQRQIDLGLMNPEWKLSPRTPGIPDWESLDEDKQDEMDLKMAVFAAMVDRVDQNIGKLVERLKAWDVYDNTLILFLSDNGACQEGGMLGRGEFRDVEQRNREHSNSYGEAWANASSTPFRLYKHFVHEGGAATPFFAHWPAKIAPREDWYDEPAQLIDVMPTLIDLAGGTYPRQREGKTVPALDGISLRPALEGKPLRRQHPLFYEHENNAAVHEGDWKLVGRGVATENGTDESKWELYNLAQDRTETTDLAADRPEKVRDLAAKWEAWAERVGVYPKRAAESPSGTESQRKAGAQPKAGTQRGQAENVQAEPNPPQVRGTPITISAIVRNRKPHGVVLAHGGLRSGYALHFVDGRPAFSIRNEGELTELIAGEPVSGRVSVLAKLDDEFMSIFVDDREVVRRKSPGLLAAQPIIGLYAGLDFGDPVGDYKAPNRFNGRLVSYRVDAGSSPVEMRTPWGEELDQKPEAIAWREYPRPALRREQWTNLNGRWRYAVSSKSTQAVPETWEGQIRVPFAIESPLSGVERRLSPEEALWYQRTFDAEKRQGRRYRLNFEAVDYQSTVWVNGQKVGENTGGNLPFSFDITDALRDGENELTLRVTDATDTAYQLHGKQRLNPRGIWYTPVSGIWQTVWMEDVPSWHIVGMKVTPRIDGTVAMELATAGQRPAGAMARLTVKLEGRTVALAEGPPHALRLVIPQPQLWSPESPTLYDVTIQMGDDVVETYIGLREIDRRRDAEGHWRFTLNGKEVFPWGTLDQGWWPDGLLTPPSDEAMRSDIEFLKSAGFNTIRKHIKVEPRRYYTHCDRLGMLVWQDQVSAMADNPEWTRLQPDPETKVWPESAHRQFMAELQLMMDTLQPHPCIVQWVPFNERWGQHQTMEVGKWTVDYDPTRHVNIASGGNFFPVGHVVDHHQYPHPDFPFDLDQGGRFDDFVKVVGEFGGHGFPVDGHLWDPNARNWGYGGLPENQNEWEERYRESIRRLAELRRQGIAAGIYTQTTDVEGEINGLITYDRRVPKVSAGWLRDVHEQAGLTESD